MSLLSGGPFCQKLMTNLNGQALNQLISKTQYAFATTAAATTKPSTMMVSCQHNLFRQGSGNIRSISTSIKSTKSIGKYFFNSISSQSREGRGYQPVLFKSNCFYSTLMPKDNSTTLQTSKRLFKKYLNSKSIFNNTNHSQSSSGSKRNYGHWDRWDRHNKYQQQRRSFFSFLDNLSPNTVIYGIIGTNVLVFIGWKFAIGKVQSFKDTRMIAWMNRNFSSSVSNFMSGRVWTTLTAAFSHIDMMHLLVNMMVLHSFGASIISVLGPRRFLGFYMGSSIVASLGSLVYHGIIAQRIFKTPTERLSQLRSQSVGASGAITSMTVLFACMNPKATFLIFFVVPMPAWAAVVGFVGFDLYRSATSSNSRIDNAGHLGGAAAGLAYYWYKIRPLIRRF